MRIIASLFFISFFSSCIVLSFDIGGNDYDDVTAQDKERIKSFEQLTKFANDNNYYEVDSSHLSQIMASNELVWIHTWRPFCSAKKCQYIKPFEATAEKHEVKLYMVSETYDLRQLDKIIKQSNFKLPVFILNNNYYGSKIDKTDVRFQEDITGQKVKSRRKELCGDYIFKKGKLFFKGNHAVDKLDAILGR